MTQVELYGGPHDGQTMRIAVHVPFLRIPVAGTANATVPTFADPDVPLSTSLLVAIYERGDLRGQTVMFSYIGQELLS